jgi:glucan 1,3-beta-glucosidase
MQQWVKEGGVELATKNLQQHYDTFITEQDFAQIAGAGLNWVRIPIGYWAIMTLPGEPFIEGLAWNYFLKAIQWARKYGLRIELDLHAIPGSQNGYNHGGRLGVFNFLNSPAGLVSADRTLDIIRTLTEFITQPSVANIIPAFGVLNEPNIPVGIGLTAIQSFYAEAYNTVRNVTGLGQGKGPMIFLHDGFMGLNSYSGFMQGGDRVGWDLHPYVCFVPPFNGREVLPVSACNGFQANTDAAFQQFGVTIAGEFSLAPNDCGLFLNGPFQGVRYDGSFSSGAFASQGSCVPFDDWQNYSATTKQQMHDAAIAQMSAFQNFFFWTWKIGNSLRTGGPVNPNWSYLLGLQQGWMPTNPMQHLANGCANLQSTYNGITKTSLDWQSTFADYQTGGASTYSPATASYPYPPASIASSGLSNSLTASLLPTYTPTGAHLTPNAAAPTAPTATVKNEPIPTYNAWPPGAAYTAGSYVAIAGCNYFPDVWQNVTSVPDGWPCSGTAAQKRDYSNIFKKRQPSPAPTPMPIMRR